MKASAPELSTLYPRSAKDSVVIALRGLAIPLWSKGVMSSFSRTDSRQWESAEPSSS